MATGAIGPVKPPIGACRARLACVCRATRDASHSTAFWTCADRPSVYHGIDLPMLECMAENGTKLRATEARVCCLVLSLDVEWEEWGLHKCDHGVVERYGMCEDESAITRALLVKMIGMTHPDLRALDIYTDGALCTPTFSTGFKRLRHLSIDLIDWDNYVTAK